jgi:hypothetical protein
MPIRAIRLLYRSSPETIRAFWSACAGACAGRYRIRHSHMMKLDQLDSAGKNACKRCFPRGRRNAHGGEARYRDSQALGVGLRWPASGDGENGIVYDSVRRAGGVNICVYRPSLIRLPVNQADHYEYRWNAAGQVSVLRLTNVPSGNST